MSENRRILLRSPHGRAEVSRYGAQVLSAELGGQPLLWLQGPDAASGKAIRGGVPICFPWFGPHPDGLPQHGFARILDWDLVAVEPDRVVLALDDDPGTRALWPHRFHAEMEIALGSTLHFTFSVVNPGDDAFRFTYALHSYFAVGVSTAAYVDGLDGCRRTEAGHEPLVQAGPVVIGEGLDATFEDVPDRLILRDGDRHIAVDAVGMPSGIVWNPGPGFGNGWPDFVCVERGRIGDAAVTVNPGERHTASMRLGRLDRTGGQR